MKKYYEVTPSYSCCCDLQAPKTTPRTRRHKKTTPWLETTPRKTLPHL